MDYNKNELFEFAKACDEFIDGKFILADVKIANILKKIADSTDIYNILAECMINFDFSKEFSKSRVSGSVGANTFRLPTEVHKLIPLVFCLLVEIDKKNIDFNYFLRTQFPFADTQKEEYDSFAQNVILPFKESILQLFDVNTKELYEQLNQEEKIAVVPKKISDEIEEEDKDDFFKSMIDKSYDIKDSIKTIKNIAKRENVTTLLDGIEESCKIKNIKITNALVYALNQELKGEKYFKTLINNLNNLYFTYFK